jgi:hypothetical protein
VSESHQPAIHAAPARPDYAAIARRATADLATLRAAVEARGGASNAAALHDHAAQAFHRLLDASGAYAPEGT